jgi:iron-sulfur cluster repair protein YtfE (RIC family)
MLAAEVREHLLAQHHALRHLLDGAVSAAHALLDGRPALLSFRRALAELRRALTEHNQAEEALLEPMLVASEDRLGHARVARMREEHHSEHEALGSLLLGTDRAVARRIDEFAEELLAHMDAEERTFLHPRVLA